MNDTPNTSPVKITDMNDLYRDPAVSATVYTILLASNGNCRLVYGESTPDRTFIPRGAISTHINDLISLKRVIEDAEKKYKDINQPRNETKVDDFLNQLKQEAANQRAAQKEADK